MNITNWKKEIGWHVLLVAMVCLNILCTIAIKGSENFSVGDSLCQYMPTYKYIGDSIAHGEFPLISNSSWNGGALIGEYQFGVFSVFHVLLLWALFLIKAPILTSTIILGAIYCIITASGSFALARYYKLPVWLAIIVAWSATFNGYTFGSGSTCWLPVSATFAWLPWAWLAMLWALQKKDLSRVWLPSIFIYLITTGGWPFTVLMAAWLTVWIACKEFFINKNRQSLYIFLGAWVLGIVLSLPALASLIEFYMHSQRRGGELEQWGMTVPLRALGGFFTPTSHALWNYGTDRVYQSCLVVFSNIVVPALFATTVFFHWKHIFYKFRYELAFLVLTLFLCMIPMPKPFRFSFRWLALLHLVFAIITARAWIDYLEEKNLSFWGKWLLNFFKKLKINLNAIRVKWVMATLVYLAAWGACSILHKYVKWDIVLYAIIFAVIAVAWLITLLVVKLSKLPLVAVIVALLTSFIGQILDLDANEKIRWSEVPLEKLQQVKPFNKDRIYLFLFDAALVYAKYNEKQVDDKLLLRFGNIIMYSDMQAINGYSPMRHSGFSDLVPFQICGQLKPQHIEQVLHSELQRGRMLEQLGIDGLLIPKESIKDESVLVNNGWEKVHETPYFVIYEHTSPPAIAHSLSEGIYVVDFLKYVQKLRSSSNEFWQDLPTISMSKATPMELAGTISSKFDEAKLSNFKHEQYKSNISVEVDTTANSRPSLIAVHRSFYPGHRLFFNEREVELIKIDGALPAAIIPAGEKGTLELRFEPWYLIPCLILACGAWICVITLGVRNFLQRKIQTIQA